MCQHNLPPLMPTLGWSTDTNLLKGVGILVSSSVYSSIFPSLSNSETALSFWNPYPLISSFITINQFAYPYPFRYIMVSVGMNWILNFKLGLLSYIVIVTREVMSDSYVWFGLCWKIVTVLWRNLLLIIWDLVIWSPTHTVTYFLSGA